MAEPIAIFEGHKGPVYDLKFYDDGKEALLFRFGISSRICFYFSMLHFLISCFLDLFEKDALTLLDFVLNFSSF